MTISQRRPQRVLGVQAYPDQDARALYGRELHFLSFLAASGVSITADIAAIYATKGRFGQEINFNSYGSPFPSSTSRALFAKALARL